MFSFAYLSCPDVNSHFVVGSIDKSVDHTDDDDRNIASEAQVQSSSADVEVQHYSSSSAC